MMRALVAAALLVLAASTPVIGISLPALVVGLALVAAHE